MERNQRREVVFLVGCHEGVGEGERGRLALVLVLVEGGGEEEAAEEAVEVAGMAGMVTGMAGGGRDVELGLGCVPTPLTEG